VADSTRYETKKKKQIKTTPEVGCSTNRQSTINTKPEVDYSTRDKAQYNA
jgi:hypothetical protein